MGGWLHAAANLTGNARPTSGGVFCVVLRGVSWEPRGARAAGCNPAQDARHGSLCPRRRAPRLPGLRRLWDQDLMSANLRTPCAQRLQARWPGYGLGAHFSPMRAFGFGRSPGAALSALRFAFPGPERTGVERGVMQMGVQIERQMWRLPLPERSPKCVCPRWGPPVLGDWQLPGGWARRCGFLNF